MRSIVLAAVLSLMGIAAHAQTPTLVDFATISMSAPGVPRTVTDTVCASDGRDLVCDRTVYVKSSGFVGIGTPDPSVSLHIQDASGGNFRITDIGRTGTFDRQATIFGQGASFDAAGIIHSGVGFYRSRGSIPSRTNVVNGDVVGRFDYLANANGNQLSGWSLEEVFVDEANGWPITSSSTVPLSYRFATLDVSGTHRNILNITPNQRIGVMTTAPAVALHVSGTVRLANGGEACDANRTGAIRYTGGDFSFCRNGSAWEALTSLAGGGGLGDRIVSGTSAVVVNSASGIVSITQLGSVASYVHPSLGYIGPGVSTTGPISGTEGYFGLSLRVGKAPVNAMLTIQQQDEGIPSLMMKNTSYSTANFAGLGMLVDNSGRSIIRGGWGTSRTLTLNDNGGNVAIGKGAANAQLDVSGTVSSTGVYLAGTANQCATSADEGLMFRNAATRKLQVCVIRY